MRQLRMEFILKLVAWASHTRPRWIASLGHETRNHTVEDHAVVETVTRKENKVVYGDGRLML